MTNVLFDAEVTRPVPDMESSLPLRRSAIVQLGHIQQALVCFLANTVCVQ